MKYCVCDRVLHEKRMSEGMTHSCVTDSVCVCVCVTDSVCVCAVSLTVCVCVLCH